MFYLRQTKKYWAVVLYKRKTFLCGFPCFILAIINIIYIFLKAYSNFSNQNSYFNQFTRQNFTHKTLKRILFTAHCPIAKPLRDCYYYGLYGLSGIYYRVASLSKSYLTVTEIIIQSLKSIGQFLHT